MYLKSFIESNFGVKKIIYFHGKDTSVDINIQEINNGPCKKRRNCGEILRKPYH